MSAKDTVANAAIGATALAGFLGNLGQAPTATANDLADSYDRDVASREISVADIRTSNQPTTSARK